MGAKEDGGRYKSFRERNVLSRPSFFAYISRFVLVLFLIAGCDAQNRKCAARKALTYNTELLDHAFDRQVPNNRHERLGAIVKELNRVDADIVCLQEVWIGQDLEAIVKGVSSTYPFSASKLHVDGQLPCQTGLIEPPCRFMDLTNFMWCTATHKCFGAGVSLIQIKQCISSACYLEFMRLSQECISCNVVSLSNPVNAFMNCAGNGVPAPGLRSVNTPGLLMLSKSPLLNARYTDYHPFSKELIERGYLEATVEEFGTVVCTHHTHIVPLYFEGNLERMGAFRSYIEQGDSERKEVIDKFRNVNPLLLMGDFNVGDASSICVLPTYPEKFLCLANVFNVKPLAVCTYCAASENPYNLNSRSAVNVVIDHIFYKGHNVKEVNRVFTPHDRVLRSSGLPLSDHFGVLAIVDTCDKASGP